MARLFCGPDTSPWVPIAHDTPQATVSTFLEAVRRDDPQQVYRCLSYSLCRERGLDGMVVAAAWDKLREQTPGLHLLGYAKAPIAPQRGDQERATFELDAEGVRVTLDLERESYWELRYLGQDGRIRESSVRLDEPGYRELLSVAPALPDPLDDLPQARIGVSGRIAVHPGVAELSSGRVESLSIGREWKIAAIAVAKP
jgi:hypothetical protein